MFFDFGGAEDHFFTGGSGGGRSKKEVDNEKFYKILEISKDATSDQIRKSYRKLAAKHHPDKPGGNQAKFQELQAAYEILSDPEKKSMYDKYGEDGLKEGMGGSSGDSIFDLLMNRGGGGKKGKPKTKSLLHPLKVTLEDVYCGSSKFIEIKRYRICETCTGSGSKDPKADTKCSGCKGNGRKTIMQRIQMGIIQQTVDCSDCRGTGTKISEKDKCKSCKGEKATQQTKALEVHIDKGAPDGKKYTFTGESDETPDVTPGDVIVEIQVVKHSKFTRKGADLVYKADINLIQALTGFEFVIEHLDKRKIRMYSKPGQIIKPGEFMTCQELGMPFFEQPYRYGNLFIDFNFKFPSTVDNNQKEMLFKAFPNLIPKQLNVKCEENYTLTEYKKEHENTHHAGGKKDNRADEDDDEESGHHGGARNVQCQNQ